MTSRARSSIWDLYFAPDPSRARGSCTIGGNVSENLRRADTLAYGVTANHVTGLELVLPDGETVRIGGKIIETPGYDLNGLLLGSEGTLALVTEITVRLSRKPEAVKTLLAVYETLDDTTESVVRITVRGRLLPPHAGNAGRFYTSRRGGLRPRRLSPKDCAAVLLIEVEGLTRDGVEAQAAEITEVCRLHHARKSVSRRTIASAIYLWKGRKNAFRRPLRTPRHVLRAGRC